MSNLWERFDGIASAEEVQEAKSKFEPIDEGNYDVILEELIASESKDGLPMLKGKFRTIEGNRVIFYNQMLQNLNYPNMTAVNIADAVKFVGDLLDEEIEFTTLGKLAEIVETVPVGKQYRIYVYYGQKDIERKFAKIKMSTVPAPSYSITDDDVPF